MANPTASGRLLGVYHASGAYMATQLGATRDGRTPDRRPSS